MTILALLTLMGCAVGPNFKPPKARVPEDYYSLDKETAKQAQISRTIPQPVVLVQWWQAFHDNILD
ncbi:MAG: hypothetical protein WAU47_02915, partial [Desulfobaccales bacterium]